MKRGTPANERGFLVIVTRNEIRAHKRRRRPDIDREADVDMQVCDARDPEEEMRLAELWDKLERYVGYLSPQEQQVFQARAIEALTFAEIAEEVGRHHSTVAYQYKAALKKLEEFAAASERAADLRLQAASAGA